jgi:hypothetical protein
LGVFIINPVKQSFLIIVFDFCIIVFIVVFSCLPLKYTAVNKIIRFLGRCHCLYYTFTFAYRVIYISQIDDALSINAIVYTQAVISAL